MGVWQGLKQRFQNLSGGWLIFFAAFLWSTAGAVVKSFETHSLLLVGLRSLIGGLALVGTIRPRRIKFDRWLFLTILGYAGLATVAVTTLRLTAAVVVIAMQYTAPVWIFLGNWVLKKQLDKQRIIVMLLIVVAIVLFLLFPVPGSSAWGNWLSVLMGVFFAAMSVCMKKTTHRNPLGIVSILNLGTALLVLPVCLVLPSVPIYVAAADWGYILFLALFQLAGGYVFYTIGITKVNPQKATLLAMWEFILTPVWAFLVVREMPTAIVWLACGLLICALLWDNHIDSRAQPGQQHLLKQTK